MGVCSALNPEDYITSTHRPHGHALAKGLTPFEILTELFGKGTGCCKGKGGSMHIGNIDKGMPPAIAIVAGGIPMATGMALALKMQQRPQVVACFFGDGATSEGAFHEGVNMGAIWNLPVIYVCENNFYGASTHTSKITRLKNMARARCWVWYPWTRPLTATMYWQYMKPHDRLPKNVATVKDRSAGAINLPHYRPFAPRPLSLPTERRTAVWNERDPILVLGMQAGFTGGYP